MLCQRGWWACCGWYNRDVITFHCQLCSLRQFALLKVFLIFSLILGASLLVLLVLGDEVVHVGLGLGELHLIHALAGVPVEESLATEHRRELLRDALEQLLDGGAVADEGRGHLEASRWDVADRRFDVVWNPLNEVAAVFVLHVQHLLVDLTKSTTNMQCNTQSHISLITDNILLQTASYCPFIRRNRFGLTKFTITKTLKDVRQVTLYF